ncbi:hypothetical protein BKI52_02510 [marine bacterium AO1-C]|nr:hypothetical protein BKI52_02510 [marine bacterium AO1-C]
MSQANTTFDEGLTTINTNDLFQPITETIVNPKKTKQVLMISTFIGFAFFCLAIYLAYKHGRGFWGYVGYILLAGIATGGISSGIGLALINPKQDLVEKEIVQY